MVGIQNLNNLVERPVRGCIFLARIQIADNFCQCIRYGIEPVVHVDGRLEGLLSLDVCIRRSGIVGVGEEEINVIFDRGEGGR